MLVHGACASASGWTGVIQRLQAAGYTVDAPPNGRWFHLYRQQEPAMEYLATITHGPGRDG